MRVRSLAAAGILCCAQAASAQVQSCRECVLGIYDDKDRTRTTGTASGATKDVFVGVDLPTELSGFCAVGFSISGLEGLHVDFEVLREPDLRVGDCVEFDRNCGLILAWDNGQPTAVTILRLTLTALGGTLPANRELRIRLHLPPGNPALDEPYITLCDQPDFSNLFPTAGVYVLNPTTPVAPATWSRTKALYESRPGRR